MDLRALISRRSDWFYPGSGKINEVRGAGQ